MKSIFASVFALALAFASPSFAAGHDGGVGRGGGAPHGGGFHGEGVHRDGGHRDGGREFRGGPVYVVPCFLPGTAVVIPCPAYGE